MIKPKLNKYPPLCDPYSPTIFAPVGILSVSSLLPPFPPTLNVAPAFVLKVTESSQSPLLNMADVTCCPEAMVLS